VRSSLPCATAFDEAVAALRQGRLVAYPTESWYGLGADVLNEQALAEVYRVKGRPFKKPLLVLVRDCDQLGLLVSHIPPPYQALMRHFWPGPLSLVFPAQAGLSPILTAGSGTVAIRYTSCLVAGELLCRFGGPITGTSANISGTKPCRSAGEVEKNLNNSMVSLLDGGTTPGGAGSTLVSWENNRLVCLRRGQIPFSYVEDVVC